MDKLDCTRQASTSAPHKPCDLGKIPSTLCFFLLSSVRRRISWNKGYHVYRKDIKGRHRVTFYNKSCSDTDNCEERWGAEMEGPPTPYSSCSFSLRLVVKEIPWRFLDSLPWSWKCQPTDGPRITPSDFWAGVSSTKRARKRTDENQEAWPLELLASRLDCLTRSFKWVCD